MESPIRGIGDVVDCVWTVALRKIWVEVFLVCRCVRQARCRIRLGRGRKLVRIRRHEIKIRL